MGFTKSILRAGNGVFPQRGQSVTVHCTGYGKNRDLTQKFWSTKDPGQGKLTYVVSFRLPALCVQFLFNLSLHIFFQNHLLSR